MTSWGARPNSIRIATNPKSLTAGFVLTGVSSETLARATALGYSPAIYSGLFRSNLELVRITPDAWNVDVTYGPYERKEREAGDFKWNFDTTGRTKHVTQGYSHVQTYVKSGATAIDFKGAINSTDNGVDGVDVPDKAFAWTEEWTLLAASYAFTYATILGELTGAMNTGYFRGFPAYTVRFDGATGGQSAKDPDLLEVAYRFSVSPTESGITVGEITGIYKLGWDHASVFYREEKDEVSNTTRLVPQQVDIDRVLRTADFSLLGIG
jgi:hypothetical protein